MYEEIRSRMEQAVSELLAAAKLKRGDLLVIGCSSSEVMGQRIGTGSSMEAAKAVYAGCAPVLSREGIALIVEQATAERYGYEMVNVRPQPKAGGSLATVAWESFSHPVAVEHIRAKAGMDIGGTLIGMHLQEVAVPVRLSVSRIGEAVLLCARTRPKFIGGERAQYCPDLR